MRALLELLKRQTNSSIFFLFRSRMYVCACVWCETSSRQRKSEIFWNENEVNECDGNTMPKANDGNEDESQPIWWLHVKH